jgi:putative hydrolase of the HAD superfamily
LPHLRALFLDAGGTLFRERTSRAAIYAACAREHGIDASDADLAVVLSAVHADLPRELPEGFRYSRPWFRRYIAEVLRRLGAGAVPPPLEAALFARFESAATFQVYGDVEPALAGLARRGLRLGVVSNWTPALAALLEGMGLRRRFAFVLDSATEHVEKPDPEIFLRALARAGVAAHEALHAGDSHRHDVAGARAAGLLAIQLDRDCNAEPTPAGTIRSLLELLPLVDRIGRGDESSIAAARPQ